MGYRPGTLLYPDSLAKGTDAQGTDFSFIKYLLVLQIRDDGYIVVIYTNNNIYNRYWWSKEILLHFFSLYSTIGDDDEV